MGPNFLGTFNYEGWGMDRDYEAHRRPIGCYVVARKEQGPRDFSLNP